MRLWTRLLDPQSLHLLVEAFPGHPQLPSRHRLASTVHLEGASDQPGFDSFQRVAQGLARTGGLVDRLHDAEHARRQEPRRDQLPWLRQGEGALDLVLQLTHVAGPTMGEEQALCGGGQSAARLVVRGTVARDEVACKGQDVVGSLAQGWDRDREDREAIVEIFAEATGLDFSLE